MSSLNPPASVEDRVQSLERQNQILIGVAVAALVVVVLLLLVVEGQIHNIPVPQPFTASASFGNLNVDQLQSSRITILGKNPGSNIVLAQSTDGMPTVCFFDRDKPRMTLSLNPDGDSVVAMLDRASQPQVTLSARDRIGCQMRFVGLEGQSSVIGVGYTLGPNISLIDATRKTSIFLCEGEGNPRIDLSDRTGRRISLIVANGGSALVDVAAPGDPQEGMAGMMVGPGVGANVTVSGKGKRSRSLYLDP